MNCARLAVIVVVSVLTFQGWGQSYFLNGDAQAAGTDCYNITPNSSFQNGTVWYANQLDLSLPFELEFYMSFGSSDANGADGMVFVLQTEGTDAIGLNGSGMGFQGFNPSFGIEFDTYSNNAQSDPAGNMNDPVMDHVAFLRNGNVNHNSTLNVAGPVQADATNANVETGLEYPIRITWNPTTDVVELYFNCVLRISHTIDLHNTVFGGNPLVYFGFTGSTGFYFNSQSVCLQQDIIPSPEELFICPGESIQINAGGDPSGIFNWTPSTGLNAANIQNPVASPNATTNYTVEYFDLCGNNLTKEITVNVLPLPTADAGTDIIMCDGENAQTNSFTEAINSIAWTTTNGSILGSNTSVSITASASGIYEMNVTSPEGCTNTDDVAVVVHPNPILVLPSSLEICPGTSATITATGNFDTISWSNGETTPTIDVNAGVYTATVSLIGCESSADIDVTEVVLPIIDLGGDITACETEVVVLQAGTAVLWSTGSTGTSLQVEQSGIYTATAEVSGCTASDEIEVTIFQSTPFSLGEDSFICPEQVIVLSIPEIGLWQDGTLSNEYSVTSPGTYSAIIENGPCVDADSRTFIASAFPSIDLGEDQVACNNEQVFIGDADENADNYEWNNGSTEHLIEASISGEYMLTATNECGSVTDTILVTIEDCDFYIFAPSAFTPDNDGTNDVWRIITYQIDAVEVFVFNRWGDVVFYTNDASIPWTGDFKNGDYYVSSGVYTYLIKYTAKQTQTGSVTGHINLLR